MINPSIVKAAQQGTPMAAKPSKRRTAPPIKDKELRDGDFAIPPQLAKYKNRTTESILEDFSAIM